MGCHVFRRALDLLRAVSIERRMMPTPAPTRIAPVLDPPEAEVFTLARKAVDEKQHARAVHILRDCRSDKAVFLRTYAQYIVRTTPLCCDFISFRGRSARRKRYATGICSTVRVPWAIRATKLTKCRQSAPATDAGEYAANRAVSGRGGRRGAVVAVLVSIRAVLLTLPPIQVQRKEGVVFIPACAP
jgi:hypothetical protein